MMFWRLTVCTFLIFILASCGMQSYEEKFFSISDVPPKFDNTICEDKIGELFRDAEKHIDFLIEQVKNTEKIGSSYDAVTYIEIDSSYYPITYRLSDIANSILSYRYGSISNYYPEFQINRRGNRKELGAYVSELYHLWMSLKNNGTLTPIKGVCDNLP